MAVQPKRTIGILGGMGPAASAHLYNKIIAFAQHYYGASLDCEFPEMILHSLPLVDWDTTGFLNLASVKRQLLKSVRKLERAGSDFIIIACNTVHHFYKNMQNAVDIPIVNMIEETVTAAQMKGYSYVGILATESSNKLGIYQKELRRKGIKSISVDANQQKIVTNTIAHVEGGKQDKKDVKNLQRIIKQMSASGAQAIILGCTELPLAITQKDSKLPLFSSTNTIVECSLAMAYGFKPMIVQDKKLSMLESLLGEKYKLLFEQVKGSSI